MTPAAPFRLFTALLLASLPLLPVQAREAAPAAATVQAPARFIELEGGRNFRDAGGYRTADGRTVRWGLLYRSGAMGHLAPSAMSRLEQLGIRAIIDLRQTDERATDQSNWLAMAGMGYWTRDYSLMEDTAALAGLFADPSKLTAESVRAMMTEGYRQMPRALAPQYRELFARLATPGKGAVVVNCTAGKDRTGIATALVLTALGVPYATVREDFLLSNGAPGMKTLLGGMAGPWARLPAEVVQPLVGVEGEYLDAAFDQIARDHGSVEGYLATDLGVGPAELAALRRRLLD